MAPISSMLPCILLFVGLPKATPTPKADVINGILPTANNATFGPYVCWKCQGPFELDCFHTEALTLEPYPLSAEMLERSIPYRTSDAQIHRVFQMARDTRVLNVVAIGGSVTAGHQCVSPSNLRGKSCAWPYRLQQWCERRVQDFQCEIVNAARPGTNIENFLHDDLNTVLPVESAINLVIVDYGVNDAVLEHFGSDIRNVKTAHDVLIRHVRNTMNRSPAMIYTGSFIAPARVAKAPLQATNMAEVHSEVAQQYDIPMVYGPAAPDWRIQDASSRFGVFDGCKDTSHYFQMFAAEYVGTKAPQELVSSSGWAFDNDIKGNPGFIGFAGAIALFEMPCGGQSSILDIKYLQSYEGMGAVRVFVGRLHSDSSTSTVVDGLWKSRASMETHEAISIPAGNGNVTVAFKVLSKEDEKDLLPDAAKDIEAKAMLRANRMLLCTFSLHAQSFAEELSHGRSLFFAFGRVGR